jgi:hypothetical protein
MSFKYEFVKTCFAKRLEEEIRSSNIVTALSHITVTLGVKTEVWFRAELSSGDLLLLEEIVADHNEEPTSDAQLVVIDQPKDANNRPIITNSPFSDSAGFRFRGASFKDTVNTGTTKDIDYALTEERYINGGILMVDNIGEEDKATFQVVDKDNILGFGAGLVLDTFIDGFYVPKDVPLTIELAYPAKIIQGLYLRCKYTSTHESGAVVKCNLFLHKKT